MYFVSAVSILVLTLASINAAPNPYPKVAGTQFITGPCTSDSDCASNCCEQTQNICRAPLSLNPGVESCKDGRTPDFNNGPARFVQIGDAASDNTAVDSTSSLFKKAPGTQFITGPCTSDSDCASNCCEQTQNICRAPLSLNPGVESCKDGRTPDFNNGPARFVQISN